MAAPCPRRVDSPIRLTRADSCAPTHARRCARQVLHTLGIENGCMHSEIKLEPRGPVLIEVNCRVHGGEGTWAPMAEACCGYSAVSALLDAYFTPAAFAALPALPGAGGLRAFAMEAKLRSAVAQHAERAASAAPQHTTPGSWLRYALYRGSRSRSGPRGRWLSFPEARAKAPTLRRYSPKAEGQTPTLTVKSKSRPSNPDPQA